jgi:hypothetical protein
VGIDRFMQDPSGWNRNFREVPHGRRGPARASRGGLFFAARPRSGAAARRQLAGARAQARRELGAAGPARGGRLLLSRLPPGCKLCILSKGTPFRLEGKPAAWASAPATNNGNARKGIRVPPEEGIMKGNKLMWTEAPSWTMSLKPQGLRR